MGNPQPRSQARLIKTRRLDDELMDASVGLAPKQDKAWLAAAEAGIRGEKSRPSSHMAKNHVASADEVGHVVGQVGPSEAQEAREPGQLVPRIGADRLQDSGPPRMVQEAIRNELRE